MDLLTSFEVEGNDDAVAARFEFVFVIDLSCSRTDYKEHLNTIEKKGIFSATLFGRKGYLGVRMTIVARFSVEKILSSLFVSVFDNRIVGFVKVVYIDFIFTFCVLTT